MGQKIKFKKTFLNPMELKKRGIDLVVSITIIGEDEIIVEFADKVTVTKGMKEAIAKILNQERWREEE